MIEYTAKLVFFLISLYSLSMLEFTEIARAANPSGNMNGTAPIHENSVLKPGPEGKDLIEGLVGKPGKGKAIYKRYCVYCHGKKGRGDGMAAIGLNPSPADLTQSFSYADPQNIQMDQRLFDVITYGRKGSHQIRMPAWGPVLSKQERIDVLAYVKSMFGK